MRSFLLLCALGCSPGSDKSTDKTMDSGETDLDGDGYAAPADCDDGNAAVHPGSTEVQANGIDDDCDLSTCFSSGFESTATPHALPTSYGSTGAQPFDQPASAANCSDNTPAHLLADFTGDGRLDLAVTFVCGDDELTGDTRWLLHAGTAEGFVETASDFTVPDDYGAVGAAPFANSSSTMVCGDGIPAHFVRDLDGDGLPELVISEVCSDTATGYTRWLVHSGTSSGFAAEASSWSLPGGYGSQGYVPFASAAGVRNCGKDIPGFALADLNADGRDDLVVTSTCSETETGGSRWWMYENSGTGFATAAASYALPAGYAESEELPFQSAAASTSCGESVVAHALVDVNGDSRLDLVVTETCDGDTTVGDERWLVHLGESTGFATAPREWALPAEYGATLTTPFSATDDIAACTDNTPGHILGDIDGDALPDLVITDGCSDTATGNSLWPVHRNNGSSFDATAISWGLPEGYGVDPFTFARSATDCTLGAPAFGWFDHDGSAQRSLVITASCTDSTVGDTKWAVHPPNCDL
jgi:hypothetical protein